MAPHLKMGNGFAIRYGGRGNIQWFKGEDFERLAGNRLSALPPTHPAIFVMEAANTAALFLQWWEIRKQTFLQTAQHEERRVLWLTDILAEWYGELQHGHLRTDTTFYLDREITRLLNKIQEHDMMDVPSSLLLHVDRFTHLLVSINSTVNQLIGEQLPNFIIPNLSITQPYSYRPYFELETNKNSLMEQVENSTKIVEATSSNRGALNGLLWNTSKLLDAKKKIKSEERLQDFMPLQHLSIELRSTHALLRMALQLKPSRKAYSISEIEAGEDGQLMLTELIDK